MINKYNDLILTVIVHQKAITYPKTYDYEQNLKTYGSPKDTTLCARSGYE